MVLIEDEDRHDIEGTTEIVTEVKPKKGRRGHSLAPTSLKSQTPQFA